MLRYSAHFLSKHHSARAAFIRRGIVFVALWFLAAPALTPFFEASSTARADGGPTNLSGTAVPPRPSTSAKNGTIGGRITDDAGKPVSAADVVVTPVGSRIGQRRTETDDDGKFSVSDLDSTVYRVKATAPSFVSSEDDSSLTPYRPGDTADIRLIKGGVITGNVNGPDGGPVVAVDVQAIRVKDANGRPVSQSSPAPARRTDDRGIYRIYDLPSGSYLVFAGGPEGWNEGIAYIGDAPTYYPSSTIDTAEEVAVGTGQEITGININYRSERGHTISGSVTDSVGVGAPTRSTSQVYLRQASTANIVAQAYVGQNSRDKSFSISGVADGQYDILAGKFTDGDLVGASPPTKIAVKGGDVTGVSLSVSAVGSISGTVTLVPLPANQKDSCKAEGFGDVRKQTAVVVTPDKAEGTWLFPYQGNSIWAPIDDKGHFTLSGFSPGVHHLEIKLPGENWYVTSIEKTDGVEAQEAGGAKTKRPERDAAAAPGDVKGKPNGGLLELKQGEKLTGLVITLSEGAVVLKGHVKTSVTGPGAKPASRDSALRLYLVPDDLDRQQNPSTFVESVADKDGAFEIRRIPPGKYKVVPQPDPSDKDKAGPVKPAIWDMALRKRLINRARDVTDVLELKTCGSVTDYSVTYDPAAARKTSSPKTAEKPAK
jgi:hypothetical protein